MLSLDARAMASPKPPDLTQRLRENAWIGDAVLELYVRSLILRQQGRVDAEMKTRFTCNQFLSCHGDPTAVEAEIGVIYQREGLDAAFTWIRDTLEPLFVKQEASAIHTLAVELPVEGVVKNVQLSR